MKAETGTALDGVGANLPPRTNDKRLPAYEFTTAALPRCEQFSGWRDSFSTILHFAEPPEAVSGFAGRQMLWDLGGLAFARVKTERLSFSSRPSHMRHDPIDHWMLTVMLRGSMTTMTPTRNLEAGVGLVQVHALGGGFAGHVSDSEMLALFIPRDSTPEMVVTLAAAEFSTLDTGMGRLLSDYLADVGKRLPILDEAALPGLVAATQAMILACVAPTPENREAAETPITLALLERARRIIQARLFERDLDAETLRQELGISRTRLYSLFEAFGGVMRYIQHRRLLDAHSALADPDERRLILQVAEQRGFTDGAEFSRAFKREFGYSPSEVRKGAKGGKSSSVNRGRIDLQAVPPGERLGALLHRLQR